MSCMQEPVLSIAYVGCHDYRQVHFERRYGDDRESVIFGSLACHCVL